MASLVCPYGLDPEVEDCSLYHMIPFLFDCTSLVSHNLLLMKRNLRCTHHFQPALSLGCSFNRGIKKCLHKKSSSSRKKPGTKILGTYQQSHNGTSTAWAAAAHGAALAAMLHAYFCGLHALVTLQHTKTDLGSVKKWISRAKAISSLSKSTNASWATQWLKVLWIWDIGLETWIAYNDHIVCQCGHGHNSNMVNLTCGCTHWVTACHRLIHWLLLYLQLVWSLRCSEDSHMKVLNAKFISSASQIIRKKWGNMAYVAYRRLQL